jgi:hypothetical protein
MGEAVELRRRRWLDQRYLNVVDVKGSEIWRLGW